MVVDSSSMGDRRHGNGHQRNGLRDRGRTHRGVDGSAFLERSPADGEVAAGAGQAWSEPRGDSSETGYTQESRAQERWSLPAVESVQGEPPRREGTPLTSRLQGVVPLSESNPSEFLQLACLYEDALGSAVEARLYRTGYQVSEALAELSLRLGRLRANARDVIELHACGVRSANSHVNAFRACVQMEEARLMTLELMGNLANFYRNYCVDFMEKRKRE